MNDTPPPTVGDVWGWPDGKLSVLTTSTIRNGFVETEWMGSTVTHRLCDGRRRDEPHIIQIAAELYGVSE